MTDFVGLLRRVELEIAAVCPDVEAPFVLMELPSEDAFIAVGKAVTAEMGIKWSDVPAANRFLIGGTIFTWAANK